MLVLEVSRSNILCNEVTASHIINFRFALLLILCRQEFVLDNCFKG